MLIRALIVLLIVLNLGAAAWWLGRPAPSPEPAPALPAGVARLQLVDEPAPVATPAVAATVAPPAVAVCFSLGPYTSQSAAAQAQVSQAQAAGGLRTDVDSEDAAFLLVGLVQGLAVRWSLSGRSFGLVEEGARLLDVQVGMFSAPNGSVRAKEAQK